MLCVLFEPKNLIFGEVNIAGAYETVSKLSCGTKIQVTATAFVNITHCVLEFQLTKKDTFDLFL